MTPRISEVLTSAGIGFRPGRWLRLKGLDLDSISVNSESGGWRDHRTGEHGSFHALCDRLCIDDGDLVIGRASIEHTRINQERVDERSRQHARTVWARGVPVVQPKRPGCWAYAELNDQREAIYGYLVSRGLDPQPLLPFIKIGAITQSKTDQDMAAQGADFFFMLPMYSTGKAEVQGNICGIQRTYLRFGDNSKYQPVSKIGRAMLGKKGVTRLAAPAGSPVILPVDGPVIAAGEGLETVASWVQAMRLSAVVCWDWSGLKAWSSALAPGEKSPTVAILVDADTSQTGQRESAAAVRRIIAHEHGKAVYLLPPSSAFITDAKGNVDWNDCLLQHGAEGFASAILSAWGQSRQNMALAPVAFDEAPFEKKKGHKRITAATMTQEIADAAGLALVMADLEIKVAEYLAAHIAYLRDADAPCPKPLLIHVTTGGGKSHLFREKVKHLIAERVPTLLLTRTHALGAEYANVGATHYHGREAIDVAAKQSQPWACRKYPVVMMTADKNHAPAAAACRSCEHGMAWATQVYDPASRPHQMSAAWLRERGLSSDTVAPCEFMGWLRYIQNQLVVVAPNASFSDGLLRYRDMQIMGDEIEENDQKRLVIIDEIPDLFRHIAVTTADLAQYAEKARRELADIKRQAAGMPSEEDQAIMDDLKTAVDDVLRPLASWLGAHAVDENIQTLPDDLRRSIEKLRVDWLPASTARWERVEMEYGQDAVIPLRAARAIIDSCQTSTLTIKSGCIEAQEMTTLGAYITAGKPCILLDATPSDDVQAAVLAAGGTIHQAIIKQNVNVIRFADRAHGRTFKNDQHKAREVEQMNVSILELAQERKEDPAVITYSTINDAASVERTGYFGRHDVGHDEWNGKDIIQWGGPILSPDATRRRYQGQRMVALMAGASAEDWPEWSGEIIRGAWVTVGNMQEQSLVPLPATPRLRAWVLNDYGNREAQIIGRARGARSEKTLQVRIHGGMPLAGLARHGLSVTEYREESGMKLSEINGERARIAEQRCLEAMAALEAGDNDSAYRAVTKWLADHNLPSVRYNTWKRVKSVYSLDSGNIQGVDELLASLFSIEESARFCGCDWSDIARDRLAEPGLPAIQYAVACIILDRSPLGPKPASSELSGDGLRLLAP